MAPMDDSTKLNKHSLVEQRPSADIKKSSSSTSDTRKTRKIHKKAGDLVPAPMTCITLKRFLWSIPNPTIAVFATCMFVSITMTIGTLTIYFTAGRQPARICGMKFLPTNENPIEYNYRPQSIATGYFNNDTHLDIVVANSAADNITIFLGYEDGTFSRPVLYSTGSGSAPHMVTVGDFNNDHRLDIAVANFGTNNVGIFLGYGNGTFVNQTALLTNSSRPVWINITDLNDDAALDIVIANYGTHSISILYGYGNGTFGRAVTYSTGYDSLPFSVVTGDFNNDNQMDLVTANHGTNNIGVFLSSGNDSFENQKTFSTGPRSRPYSVVVGYFNDDTMLDIAVANYGSNNIGVFLGYGNGTFASQATYSIGTASPYCIDVGDFNTDHRLDLVVTSQDSNNIGILFGYANGTFASPEMYSSGSFSSTSVALGDFNNDNLLDITVVNNDTNSINLLLGYDKGLAAQMTYSTGSYPFSIAVGYFNNDTELDIVVTNSYDNNVGVLLGYGNGSFVNQTTYPTSYAPRSVAVADLNDDARLDIVVANYGSDSVGVLLGYSDGSFANQITYSAGIGSNPVSVASGDFNHDNILDIVVANSGTDCVGILLGYGNGSLEVPRLYSTGFDSNPIFVAVGDLNNDNQLDIVIVNYRRDNIGIFLGYGNGSFTSLMTYSTGFGSNPFSVALGDLNNDSRLDVVVVNYGNNNVGILLGYGDGSLAAQTTYSSGSQPYSVAIGNFNNDFYLDIVVVSYRDNNVSVLFGYGNGSFANQQIYSTGYRPSSVAVGDFNGDALSDIVVSNEYSNDASVLLQYHRGMLADHIAFASGGGASLRCAIGGDLNNDGQLDIVVANYGTNNIGVLSGYGNGTFESQIMLTNDPNSHPFLIAFGDFNSDSQVDIFVANSGDNNIGVILGYGNGSFANERTYTVGSRLETIGVGDFNNDQRADIVVAYDDTDDVDILLAYNTGSFTNQITYSTGIGSNPISVAVGDLNNDSRLDIVVANYGADNVGILLGYGNGSFAYQIMYSTGSDSYPISVAVADLNNDSRLDIVVANNGTNNVGVLLGYGNGSFANQITYSTGIGSNPISVAVGDLNNDSRLDIVVANYETNNVGILLGYGDGSLVAQTTYSTGIGSNPISVAVGDLNNDSQLDIVVANYGTNNVSILLGYGNGSFASQITYSTRSSPNSVAVGDFNNDTRLDIVVANSRDNTIRVLLGYGDGFLADQITYSTGLSPNSVAVGDFNNDTQLDIIAVNYLGNTISVLSGYGNGSFANQMTYFTDYHPFSVAVGHFNNDTQMDIVVVNSGDDNIGVFLGSISFSFLKYVTLTTGNSSRPRAFAIGDLNSDDQIDIVVANSGVDNVGVFLGYGNGTFAKRTTYTTGSYPLSVAVGDVNNDTRLDIVVANSGSNTVGVLLGYGTGSFANQTTHLTYSGPQFVTVADFNSDSFLDIIVVMPDTSNIGILLGYGNGTFSDLVKFSMDYGSLPFSVVVGDFNSDRKLDFAVLSEGTDSLQIRLQTC